MHSQFIDGNVHSQLAAEKIYFPAKGSTALTGNPEIRTYVTPYAGQQVVNGQQAEVFADHYIAVHLREIGGGKTYSQIVLVLAILGFLHLRRVRADTEMFPGPRRPQPAGIR